ncbi:hypothetical protein ACSBR1_002021 [Camellia fascicularis]
MAFTTVRFYYLHLTDAKSAHLLSTCTSVVYAICYVNMMDEPESSRQKEVNSKIDNQVAPDGKDDVVDGKEEGLASQTYDSLRMLTKVDVLQMKFNSDEDAYSFYNAYAKVIGFSVRRSRK